MPENGFVFFGHAMIATGFSDSDVGHFQVAGRVALNRSPRAEMPPLQGYRQLMQNFLNCSAQSCTEEA